MGLAGTGQLAYSQFEQGLKLFSAWWEAAAEGGPCWKLTRVRLPVIEQDVVYAQLERVLTHAAAPVSAAAASSHGTGQQQHSTSARDAAEAQLAPATAASSCGTGKQQSSTAASGATEAQLAAAGASSNTSKSQDGNSTAHSKAGKAQLTAAAVAASTVVSPEALELDDAILELDALGCDDDDACIAVSAAAAAAVTTASEQRQVHIHQYSIAWHETYQVPVLYIRAFRPDGVCLSVDELMGDLPALQLSKEPGQADWTYVTAVEHPLLRNPCFMLHPCQTAERMRLLTEQIEPATVSASAATFERSTAAAAAATAAEATRSQEQAAAVCVVEAAATSATGNVQLLSAAAAARRSDEEQLLLLYMKGWFSLVAGLIGFSMVSHRFQ